MKKYRKAVWVLIPAIIVCFIAFQLFVAMQMRSRVMLAKGCYYWYEDSGVIIVLNGPYNGTWVESNSDKHLLKNIGNHWNGEYETQPEIGPNVDGYRIYKQIIVGHVSNLSGSNSGFVHWNGSKSGYFVIDLRGQKIYNGLNKQEWQKKLLSFEINREPELYKPSIYDKIFKRNKPER